MYKQAREEKGKPLNKIIHYLATRLDLDILLKDDIKIRGIKKPSTSDGK